MAKKDTYLALLRRGIDDTTANQLADAGLKIGDLKKIDKEMLMTNYGLKEAIALGVIEIIPLDLNRTEKSGFCPKFSLPKRSKSHALKRLNFNASKRTCSPNWPSRKSV